jgi:Tfp pilus assembly pilus retraction ATPase PilT
MDITELLAFTAQQNASDLHLSAGLPPMIRVDGDVRLAIKLDSPSRGSDGDARRALCRQVVAGPLVAAL